MPLSADAHLGKAGLLHAGQALDKRLGGPVVDDREPGPVNLVQAHRALPQPPQAGLRSTTQLTAVLAALASTISQWPSHFTDNTKPIKPAHVSMRIIHEQAASAMKRSPSTCSSRRAPALMAHAGCLDTQVHVSAPAAPSRRCRRRSATAAAQTLWR